MRTKNFYILLLSLLSGIVSCESIIDLGDDGLGTVLMMNAQLCTSDSSHTIMLASNSQDGIFPVETATISCYVNDKLVAKSSTIDEINELTGGQESEGQGYCLLHLDADFKPGDEVCIKADSGDLHCESSLTVPPAPKVLDVKVTECKSEAEQELGVFKFEIQIEDIQNEINYYTLNVINRSYVQVVHSWYEEDPFYQEHQDLARIHGYLPGDIIQADCDSSEVAINNTRDPIFNSGGKSIISSMEGWGDSYLDNKLNLFTDSMFRDKSYTVTVYSTKRSDFHTRSKKMSTGDLFTANNVARIRLLNLSREEYLYLTGYQFTNSMESSTYLTSDYVFPSNVKNGLGFVAINSANDYDILISSVTFDVDHWYNPYKDY